MSILLRISLAVTLAGSLVVLSAGGLLFYQWWDAGQPEAAIAPPALPIAAAQQATTLTAFQDCPNCPDMLTVPGGSFGMGTPRTEAYRQTYEGPQHQVSLAPFALAKNDVTFAEWDACVWGGGCNGYLPNDREWGRGRHPVIDVSWDDAQAYVRWLSAKTGRPYRLPSEAEWEYAARAGTTTAHYWGDDDSNTLANCHLCESQWKEQTSPVGSFPPNKWGFYDMAGNVSQWVQDCYHDGYKGAPVDGSAWTTGDCSRRMDRGSNYARAPWEMRLGQRHYAPPAGRYANFGFRVAMTLSP